MSDLTPEQREILKRAIERTRPGLLDDVAKKRIKVKEHERDGKTIKEHWRNLRRKVKDHREATHAQNLKDINENRTTGWIKRDPITREKYDRNQKIATGVNAGIIATLVGSTAILAVFMRYPHMANHFSRFVQRTGKAPASETLSPTFTKTFKSGFVQRDTTRAIEKMWGGQFGEFRSSITSIRLSPTDGALSVSGTITHGSLRTSAGVFQRTLSHNGEVHHDLLQVSARFQGKGFAEAFNSNALKQYKANGFDRVTMLANLDVGGYAWAKQGYEFMSRSGAGGISYNVRQKALLGPLSRYSSADQAAMRALIEKSRTGTVTPQDFMAIGKSNTWTNPAGHKMWLGKDALLGSNYDAVKYLTDASRARASAEARRFARESAKRAKVRGARVNARPPADSGAWQRFIDDLDERTRKLNPLTTPAAASADDAARVSSRGAWLRQERLDEIDDATRASSLRTEELVRWLKGLKDLPGG